MLIRTEPLTPDAFAPFGQVLSAAGDPDRIINQGLCGRWHDRAHLDFGEGPPGISIFDAVPRSLPYRLDMVERHPVASQAFIPMTMSPFLVIVAGDEAGRPGIPRAFLTAPGEAINLSRGTWHGVLTPLSAPGLFAVVDYVGTAPNLEEHWFDKPYTIVDDETGMTC